MDDITDSGIFWAFLVLLAVLAVCLGMWGCPRYNVWHEGLKGEAEFKRAEQNRQIVIEEAKAKNEAATSQAQASIKQATGNAEAEIIRAKGVAQANKIIGDSLKGDEAYLRYLWVNGLSQGNSPTVVYVPTESGLPILEAGRLNKGK